MTHSTQSYWISLVLLSSSRTCYFLLSLAIIDSRNCSFIMDASPPSVAKTELDQNSDDDCDEDGHDTAQGESFQGAGDDDHYGFLQRAEEEATRERSRTPPTRTIWVPVRVLPLGPPTSTLFTSGFSSHLNAVSHGMNMVNPWVLAMRAFTHMEMPDSYRLKHELNRRFDSLDFSELFNQPWLRILRSHEAVEANALQHRHFKFGMTRDPINRWFELKLGDRYHAMFAFVCNNADESGGLEKKYITKWRSDPRCDNNTEGEEGKSHSTPHFFYASVRP